MVASICISVVAIVISAINIGVCAKRSKRNKAWWKKNDRLYENGFGGDNISVEALEKWVECVNKHDVECVCGEQQ